MTSSLVGSEMCIRDRHALLKSQLIADMRFSEPDDEFLDERWRRLLCFDPVSYTHLTLPTICSV
eukprot:4445244-Prorocentrum_lima.AAC.1